MRVCVCACVCLLQAIRAQLASAPVRSPEEDDHWLPTAWLEQWASSEVCYVCMRVWDTGACLQRLQKWLPTSWVEQQASSKVCVYVCVCKGVCVRM